MSLDAALHAVLDARSSDADRVALHAEGRSWTRRQLREAIDLASARLRSAWGVRPGDRVAYLGANRSEELVLLFALARIGAVFAPLNTRLAAPELAAIVAHAQLHALVADTAHRDAGVAALALARDLVSSPAHAAANGEETQRPVFIQARIHAIDALLADDGMAPACDDDFEEVEDGAPLLLAYTSGTTGAPKGALHTHRGMLANASASIAAHAMREEDRVLTVLPLFHVGGLCIQTLPALLAGAQVVLHPRFDAGTWLAAIADMRPTQTLMVPATLRAAIAHSAWFATDLSCLRSIMAGSSIIPRALIDAVHARGVPLGQIYGSTETGPVTIVLKAEDALHKPGFAGWPCFERSVRVVDDAGVEVQGGGVGEILVRAPNVMRGYWRESNAEGFRDGWFATGDLARRDGDGCIEVVGRSRDLIISGGENVYPAELEDVLLAIDGIAEAAVVGVPDERWGEVPAAFVVRVSGEDSAMLDEATVAAAFDARLARFKHPAHIVFVDRLPRNAMGKVQAHLLRESLPARPSARSSASESQG